MNDIQYYVHLLSNAFLNELTIPVHILHCPNIYDMIFAYKWSISHYDDSEHIVIRKIVSTD